MPIPAPTLYPPFNIIRLSHVEFGVKDLAASRKFYVDILGLQVTDETDDEVLVVVDHGQSIAVGDQVRVGDAQGHRLVVVAIDPELVSALDEHHGLSGPDS